MKREPAPLNAPSTVSVKLQRLPRALGHQPNDFHGELLPPEGFAEHQEGKHPGEHGHRDPQQRPPLTLDPAIASANAASDAINPPSSKTMTRNPTQLSSVALPQRNTKPPARVRGAEGFALNECSLAGSATNDRARP